MVDSMDTELALLKQTVNGHDDQINRIVKAVDKISESIHEISLVLKHQESQKETIIRIFDEIREIKADVKDNNEKYWDAINGIRQEMPVLKLTSGWVKTGVIGFITVTVGTVIIWITNK